MKYVDHPTSVSGFVFNLCRIQQPKILTRVLKLARLVSLHMYECCCEMSFSQPLVLPSLAGNAKLRSGQTTVCQKRPGASILSWCHLGCSQFEALSRNIPCRFSANGWKKKKKKNRHCSHVQSCVQLLGQQHADTTFFNGCFFFFSSLNPTVRWSQQFEARVLRVKWWC